MQCPQCRSEPPSDADFCPECGAKLGTICSQCGTENARNHKFCKKCGQKLSEAVASEPAESPSSRAPESYTPKHLAEKILTSKSSLEGERKQVTVLFADLKGSLELLAERDPEESRTLLNAVVARMMEAVHRYEGTVNNVMGDGIMAIFGAPLAHEDHAVRACYAALRMQDAVNRYSDEILRSEGIPIMIRVGLNSGKVVVGSVGNDLKMDYTAVGQTTHLAARMEQMAKPGSILVTSEVLRLAEGYVQTKALGPIPVKGLTDPVEVYEVTGGGSVRTRLEAAARRGFSRFVGRDTEMEQLWQSLQAASDGHGQVVAVVGEAGVGKSRLLWEFTRSHRTEDWLILESGSSSYGKATAYLPVIDLLKGYFKVQDRDDHREIREKVTGKLLTLDTALENTLPAFLTLLDVPSANTQWQALDPQQRRQQTLDAFKRLLFRESQVQPVCLVFEDLHWIDSETQALLDNLIESLPTARLLLLVNYRPEYQHAWGSKTYYNQLRIDPLPPESAEELLQGLVGAGVELTPLRQLLIDRTEGNPFFLEESVRTLVEMKALVGERGAYRLSKPIETIEVPSTVQAVLAARIDRLSPEDKLLLQSASVIGETIPLTLLQAVMEISEEEVRGGLGQLQTSEFLYETALFPDVEYTFKHGLTYQVAYNSLLVERRRTLHARIVDVIESVHGDRLDEQVERLAHNTFRGEMWQKAVTYLRQAGTRAFDRWAHREAVAHFEQALEALRHFPQARETTEQDIDIRIDLRPSLFHLGELERTIHHLREAETLAETLGDQRRLLRITSEIMSYLYHIGDHIHAVESGERALSAARALEDFPVQVRISSRLGRAYTFMGNFHRAIDLWRWSVESLKGGLRHERFGMATFPAPAARFMLAFCLAELGEFGEGIGWGEEAITISEEVNDPFGTAMACGRAGYVYLVKGDLTEALPLLERSLEISRTRQLPLMLSLAESYLGYTYLNSGRVAEAIKLLEEAVERGARVTQFDQSLRIAWLSESHLWAGRTDAAIEFAQRALNLARQNNERANEAYVLRLNGEIAARSDSPYCREGEDAYQRAITLAEELGMRPLVARCHLGLGRLCRRMDDRQQAQGHLKTATTLMRDMKMGLWLEEAEAELEELR